MVDKERLLYILTHSDSQLYPWLRVNTAIQSQQLFSILTSFSAKNPIYYPHFHPRKDAGSEAGSVTGACGPVCYSLPLAKPQAPVSTGQSRRPHLALLSVFCTALTPG
jgi:hypothetical protein